MNEARTRLLKYASTYLEGGRGRRLHATRDQQLLSHDRIIPMQVFKQRDAGPFWFAHSMDQELMGMMHEGILIWVTTERRAELGLKTMQQAFELGPNWATALKTMRNNVSH